MVGVADPIGAGFVPSLARPGGNLTGVTNIASDHWVFRKRVTGDFGIVTGGFGNVTGHFGDVTDGPSAVI